MEPYRLLALSGSLRKASLNALAIQTLKELAPASIRVQQHSLADLPLFNPDIEDDGIASVASLKQALKAADGLIIASPEYAHGISGVMKNALDWLVSGDEFVDKPIMLINTSARATHGQAALKEVITTMSGNLIKAAHVTIPLLGSQMQDLNDLCCSDHAQSLLLGLDRFCEAIAHIQQKETV